MMAVPSVKWVVETATAGKMTQEGSDEGSPIEAEVVPHEEGLPASLLRRLRQADDHAWVRALLQVGHHNSVTHPTYSSEQLLQRCLTPR